MTSWYLSVRLYSYGLDFLFNHLIIIVMSKYMSVLHFRHYYFIQYCYQVNIIIPSIFIFIIRNYFWTRKRSLPTFFLHFQSVVIVYYDYYHPKKYYQWLVMELCFLRRLHKVTPKMWRTEEWMSEWVVFREIWQSIPRDKCVVLCCVLGDFGVVEERHRKNKGVQVEEGIIGWL